MVYKNKKKGPQPPGEPCSTDGVVGKGKRLVHGEFLTAVWREWWCPANQVDWVTNESQSQLEKMRKNKAM
jgi:hypothetical protein